jgi:hypothetical protein
MGNHSRMFPGFTAEAALEYHPDTLYAGRSANVPANAVVQPSLRAGGGGGGESCTARCEREKNDCRANCDADPSAGYFCYFDCRLSYMACLGGCITHGWSGGGGFIA